jgi:sarcosine oxidase
MQARCDVVVVGAGLLGLAAARALTRRGADVIVLEQGQAGHEQGGSKGSCRIFRLGYPDPGYVALARRARQPWAELEDECGQRLLHPVPQLTFGPALDEVSQAMHRAGADCTLLPGGAVAARFPQLTIGGPALLEPESCVISAAAALQALAAAVPDVRTEVTVTGLADDGRQVTVRTADPQTAGLETAGSCAAGAGQGILMARAAGAGQGIVTARAAVVCAGPWTSGLLAAGGIGVPSGATLEQVGYLAPAATGDAADLTPGAHQGPAAANVAPAPWPALPIFIGHGGQESYGLPVPGSPLYKIGLHHSGPEADLSALDQRPDDRLTARLTGLARRYLPGLHPEPVQTERCVYDNTPDEDFIVDRIGNVVIGSGTSGHGFKFGPLLGEWLASLADGAPAAPAARGFSLSRFGPAPGGRDAQASRPLPYQSPGPVTPGKAKK